MKDLVMVPKDQMIAAGQAETASGDPLSLANVEIRPNELQVLIAGRRVGFTVREFQLFHLLARRSDSVLQRAEIYRLIWGGDMPLRDRCVDVLVRRLRSKLKLVAPDWIYIHTHFGIGYRFTPEQLSRVERSQ